MIRTIPPVDRTALEQGLRRLKLRHMRQHLDDINELAGFANIKVIQIEAKR
jgi:hypothetical protein